MVSTLVLTSSPPFSFAEDKVSVPDVSALQTSQHEQEFLKARTGPHTLSRVTTSLNFSAAPTDQEIMAARIFFEPLLPTTGPAQTQENIAVTKAVTNYKKKIDFSDVTDLVQFINDNPSSRWCAAIEINAALLCFKSGAFSDALMLWRKAWDHARNGKGDNDITIANRAFARLVLLQARLGRTDELRGLLEEAGKRSFFGSDSQMVESAKQGLFRMNTDVGSAFKCGPYALESIIEAYKLQGIKNRDLIQTSKSSSQGTNLQQLKDWSDDLGMHYQVAKRSEGAPLVVPCVAHWKLGHFSAILNSLQGRWIVQDPTFDTEKTMSMTSKVLDQESDGYFLIPAGALKSGWSTVNKEEAEKVWGKGGAGAINETQMVSGAPIERQTPNPGCSGGSCDCKGMARASIWSMPANLNVADTPVSYQPPIGPEIAFRVNYNQNETNQPSSFSFTNLGANWSFNWLSYVTIDPGTLVATTRIRGGGSEVTIPLFSGAYPPDLISQAVFSSLGGGAYQRALPDGSVEIFDQADGAGNIFMTKAIDPQGNSTLIQYDANFRIATITDCVNQVSSISYVSNTVGNAGFYKVSGITDPFGRTATFIYDTSTTRLLSITDSIGLKSQVTYDSGSSFITALSTPYGTTSFYAYVPGNNGYPAKGIRCTFPDGTFSVLENWLNEPKATYYWDRHATMLYPTDPVNKIYTHCKHTKYCLNPNGILEDAVPQHMTMPLESASTIYYRYPGQPWANTSGAINKPLSISRAIGSLIDIATVGGTPAAGNFVSIVFYDTVLGSFTASYTVQAGDTLQIVSKNLATQINNIIGLQKAGVLAVASGATITIRSDSNTLVYAKGSATGTTTLSMLSAVKQTATVTVSGTINTGDQVKLNVQLPTPLPGGTTHPVTYIVLAGDSYNSIASGLAAAVNADPALQALGVSAQASGAVINMTSSSPVVQAYSQAGGAATLTIFVARNGANQLYNYAYNSIGKVTVSVDPMGRTFSYLYDSNNIDLLQITETRNGDNYQVGAWTYNGHHRPLTYTDGSGRVTQYSYNSSQQLLTITDANGKITTNTYTGTSTATISGTATAGNTIFLTVVDSGLAGGQKVKSYTVIGGDSLTSIATGLRNAVNADSTLSAIGVTATSSAAVVTLRSTSTNVTTYTGSTSGGASATISIASAGFGYLTKTDGPLPGANDITTFAYDAVGRMSQVTNSESYVIKYAYDNADRLTKTTYPDNSFEQTIYDRLDAVLVKDRIGRWSQSSFDSLDQLAYEVDPLGRKTEYVWCNCGSLAALTDPNGRTTTWRHDLQGRPIAKIYPDHSTVTYTYDVFRSKLKTRTDALGQTTVYTFNPDDELYQTAYVNAINPTGAVTNFWDYNFKRLASVFKSDWGTTSYTYNNYIAPGGAATTGGGMLQKVHNDVIPNSDITYSYDNLGRTTNRSINGASNSVDWAYDEMSRVTAETNALGNFAYAYVDNTTGSSKGTTRLASITYPNSQTTNFSWYPNALDQRLQQIQNLNPAGGLLSQFNYSYDAAGQIIQWQQQQSSYNVFNNYRYDPAGQLVSAQGASGAPNTAFDTEAYYTYDAGANRTSVQNSRLKTLRVGGTITAGDVLTVTVQDAALGAPQPVSYTVQASDTLAKAAAGLATAINLNVNLQNIGVSANAHGTSTFVNIKSASNNITSYTTSTSGGATETLKFGVFKNGVENVTIGGTITVGNVLTLTIWDSGLSGGKKTVSHSVVSGNTTTSIATSLKNSINADTSLQAIGVTASSSGSVITVTSQSVNATSYTSSTSAGATATITLIANSNPIQLAILGGTKTTGDNLTITVYDAGLPGGLQTVSYTVLAADTLAIIASAISSAVNANSQLQLNGISATVNGTVVTLQSNSPNPTSYRQSSSGTESILFTIPKFAWQVVDLGGTKTTGNVLTVTVLNSNLTGGKKSVSYTVLAADTLTSITAGLAAAINADTNLQAIGVSASSTSTVLSLESLSALTTNYQVSKSAGATETLFLAPSYGIQQSSYNNLNELTSISGGGSAHFQISSSKPMKAGTVNSQVITIQSKLPVVKTEFDTQVTRTPTETITFAFLPGYNFDGDGYSITVGGSATAGDTLNITFWDDRLPSGSETISYTVKATDTLNSIASSLIDVVNNNDTLWSLRYQSSIASLSGGSFIVTSRYLNAIVEPVVGLTSSIDRKGTETISVSENAELVIGGTITPGDKITVAVKNRSLPLSQTQVSYTVAAGDTSTSIATALKNLINGNSSLQSISLTAVSSGPKVTVLVYSNFTVSTSGGATETLTLGAQNRGSTRISIGGAPQAGDVLTVSALNGLLPGGSDSASYTVLASDTLASISLGLSSAINADANWSNIGIRAENSGTFDWSQSFRSVQILPVGTSTLSVTGTDGSSNTKSNGYALSVSSGSTTNLTFDLNGNMTSDGTNAYAWDVANRMIKITYPGSNNFSTFVYDGLSRNVSITETTAGSVTSTKKFILDSNRMCESRDGSGSLIGQYFACGSAVSGTKYFQTANHAGSVTEITDNSGALKSQYIYDSFGRAFATVENILFEFKYAEYYCHSRSGLDFTTFRAYNPALGRFMNRDPIAEGGGTNLYAYTHNEPINRTDPSGLDFIVLYDPAGGWGSGHCAVLIGQERDPNKDPFGRSGGTGYNFYEPGRIGLSHYESLSDFYQNNRGFYSPGNSSAHLPNDKNSSAAQNAQAIQAARDFEKTPYNWLFHNCADLCRSMAEAYGIDMGPRWPVSIPGQVFDAASRTGIARFPL